MGNFAFSTIHHLWREVTTDGYFVITVVCNFISLPPFYELGGLSLNDAACVKEGRVYPQMELSCIMGIVGTRNWRDQKSPWLRLVKGKMNVGVVSAG